jgi:hypothetical protein
MADRSPAGVETRKALSRAHAGQIGKAHTDARKAFLIKARRYLDGLEALSLFKFLFDPLDILCF